MPAGADRAGRISTAAVIGLAAALAAGAGLRLIWPADMEYKGDEVYSFEQSAAVYAGGPWPWIGMNNSADVPHPGMSVWVFLGLARLAGATDPVRLNIACMALNVAALGLLVVFVGRVVPLVEREPWWWAVALVSVNPLAVLFHRKIWPPSVLPAVTVVMLAAWFHRGRAGWAFAFGLVAALAGQIHPGAYFFAAGLAVWALLFDRASLRWRWAAGGAAIGLLTALPWLYHLTFVAERSAASKAHWSRALEFKFWTYWLTEPFGFSLAYSLGRDFPDFLRCPVVAGRSTYLVAGLHAALAAALLVVVGRWLLKLRRGVHLDRTFTGFTLGAAAGGYGLLLTATGLPVYRHYLIILFPLAFVWLARAAFAGFDPINARRLLGGLCAVQGCVAACFLAYIHGLDRPVRGDYGSPYRVQQAARLVAEQVPPGPRR